MQEDAYRKLSSTGKKKVEQVNARLAREPNSISGYDPKTDRWTTTADDGTILITFVLSDDVLQVNVLRMQDLQVFVRRARVREPDHPAQRGQWPFAVPCVSRLADEGLRCTKWKELDLVDHWRRYLDNPETYLRHVLDV
ncbi:hypothetical protein [Actinopolyspora saharensis]|uniref:hypothetical protein n=1 Tax=Actinopolyspora saharensis TaxID=995062 RepID=UPI003F67A8C1